MKQCFLIFLVFFISCQSSPQKEVSMYDVSRDMKRNDQERAQKETVQSSPQIKKKEYSPAETVFITALTFASVPLQVFEFKTRQKQHNFAEFSFLQVETDDLFMVEGKVKTKEGRKLDYCIFNLNCSETIKAEEKEKTFFKIELPGLMD